jgi:hypothetical protein
MTLYKIIIKKNMKKNQKKNKLLKLKKIRPVMIKIQSI